MRDSESLVRFQFPVLQCHSQWLRCYIDQIHSFFMMLRRYKASMVSKSAPSVYHSSDCMSGLQGEPMMKKRRCVFIQCLKCYNAKR